MKVSVVGTGYVGLVCGAGFAEMGNTVICVDKDEDKISLLQKGGIPIYEPGLEEVVRQNVASGSLSFTTDVRDALSKTDICFIAVSTPPAEDGSADLTHVLAVAEEIGKYMVRPMLVVDKSTVPIGTADRVRESIAQKLHERGSDLAFDVVSNPEFLKEGMALTDFMKPDRVVVGVQNEASLKMLHELYAPFTRNHDNFIVMDIRSAEMTKYAANAMLACKISFMNEIANLCERVGADVNRVRVGIGSDERIGYHFLYAGCGYGGSCFPKDVQALARTASEYGYEPSLIKAIEEVNNTQKLVVAEKVIGKFGPDLNGFRFAVWGLAFKSGTDDMREAPAISVINRLVDAGARIHAYDPKAIENAKRYYFQNNSAIEYFQDKYRAIDGVDAMLLLTDWKEFRAPDFQKMRSLMKRSVVFDGRNQYDAGQMAGLGFEYHQIGSISVH